MKYTREAMREKMEVRGYSPNTVEIYLGHLVLVQSVKDAYPSRLYSIDQGCLCHPVFFNHVRMHTRAGCTQPTRVVGNDWSIKHIPYQKKPKTLPVVLNRKEIKALLSAITNPKYHAIASTLYGAGLRISECLNLKIRDIDSENMIITVRDGKGRKDRQTVLSEKLLDTLREYYRQSRIKPDTFLFPRSSDNSKPFSKRQTPGYC